MVEQLIEFCRIVLWIAVAVLCVLLVWLIFSPVGWGIKTALQMVRFPQGVEWLFRTLARLNPVTWWRQVFDVTTASFIAGSHSKSVKVVVDQRLDQLQRSMRSTVEATRKACQNLEGLGGAAGPAAVVADVKELQRRTEAVAALGGEIPDDLVKEYQGWAKAVTTMIMLVLFAAAFAAVNGTLLNLFFRDVLTVRIYGVPAALLVSIGFIIAEMALGFGVAYFLKLRMRPAAYLLIFVIALAATFEAVIFGIVSYGFELDIPLLDETPLLKLWMAPLGIIFVTATAVVGYIFHRTKDELDDYSGAARLRKEVRAVNRFVRGLPGRWDGIAGKARAAEGAISSFVDALGNKAGALKGAIDTVRMEREAMTKALADAKVDEWQKWMDGAGGDVRLSAAQNVAIALAAAATLAGFIWTMARMLSRSAVGGWPPALLWALALASAIAFLCLGWRGFQRIQLVEADKDRVHPLRTAPVENWVLGALLLLLVAGVVTIVVQALGARGLPQALIILATGATLAVVGYNSERALMGAGYLARLTLGAVLATLAFLAAALLHLVGWPLWVLLNIVQWVTNLAALPIEWLVEMVRRWRAARGPRAPQIRAAGMETGA